MATNAPPKPTTRRKLTREQASQELLKLLTDEPQSAASLKRQLFPEGTGRGHSSEVTDRGLGVLESLQKARRIPRAPGQQGGWVRFESGLDSAIAPLDDVTFPYEWAVIRADKMFVDESYQRPLTAFVDRITRNFDPILFQVLALSDRGTRHKPSRYAIIDGQTRWVGATRRGVMDLPCIVFKNLTPEQEADIFARFQKERRGIVSWYRFRADLRSKKPEAMAIAQMVEATGYVLGDGVGQLKAVGALESCYRKDPYLLERTLSDLREAWDDIPAGPHIRGLHYFFRNFPIENRRRHDEVNDQRLVRRLKTNSSDTLKRKAIIAKEADLKGKGSTEKWMGLAIQKVYQSGG